MAKKKENKLSYLQMPLPQASKSYKMLKRSWSGLNMRQTIDTGELSMERNISTAEAPYLTPSVIAEQYQWCLTEKNMVYPDPIDIYGFDDKLIVLYKGTYNKTTNEEIKYLPAILVDIFTGSGGVGYTGVLELGKTMESELSNKDPRSVVQFNVYDVPTDVIDGGYIKKLLFFPDKKSMYLNISKTTKLPDSAWTQSELENFRTDVMYYNPDGATHKWFCVHLKENGTLTWDWLDDDDNPGPFALSQMTDMPMIEYAAVHQSRVFGVGNGKVYASAFNDYADWTIDTIDEYNESNAWVSPAQSNSKAGGDFTGITTFQNHVICFKEDFIHEVTNTKNPFRLNDVFSEGTISNRSIQDVNGRLIFVTKDDVKVYTGSAPRSIGYKLGISEFIDPISGTDGRNYYLYCMDEKSNNRFLIYDTFSGEWSERDANLAYHISKGNATAKGFAFNSEGMFALGSDGAIYKLNSNSYSAVEWCFETDLITNETVDIKHIKKIQMLADFGEGTETKEFKIYFLYDDEAFNADTSHLVYDGTGKGLKTIRVKPRQTASYGLKVHVEGKGYVKLHEMEIFFEGGGDLYV